ncbi:hypothetical protein ACFTAO_04645 [Paenibacillus rhizoplanae]|uniref:Uncharacterized protein n=2 Tax=Paenibacillus TaxID=44249 RepID=A0ABS4NZ02_9BACL|nr:hypothetical protein [Paenibacillus silagei]
MAEWEHSGNLADMEWVSQNSWKVSGFGYQQEWYRDSEQPVVS